MRALSLARISTERAPKEAVFSMDPVDKRTLAEELELLEAAGMVMFRCKACGQIVIMGRTSVDAVEPCCPHCQHRGLKRIVKKLDVKFRPTGKSGA